MKDKLVVLPNGRILIYVPTPDRLKWWKEANDLISDEKPNLYILGDVEVIDLRRDAA